MPEQRRVDPGDGPRPSGVERTIRVLMIVAGVLVVAVYLLVRADPTSTSGRLFAVPVALVVLTSFAIEWRPRLTALFATLAVVPAFLVGRLWLHGGPSGSFGWFAYAPLSSTVYSFSGRRPVVAGLAVVAALLWTVTTLGVIGLVAKVRPGPGSMRVLAIVAAVLTVPLWVPLTSRPSPWSLTALVATADVQTVRTAGLTLVVVVGVAVVLARGPVPASAAAYAFPAVAMTWTWLHIDPGVYTLSAVGEALPGWGDLLPFYVAPVAATALTGILWVLAARGARVLLSRYRPPDAVVTR